MTFIIVSNSPLPAGTSIFTIIFNSLFPSIKYFIDGNNELNIIVKIEVPAGRGEFDTIIKVK